MVQEYKENPNDEDGSKNNQSDGHYESLVQFPEFLLHVLNIMNNRLDGQLDKERLLERFEHDGKRPNEFIINLLKYRFFYDMYIGRIKAKPEDAGNNDNNDEEGIFGIRKPRKKTNIYPVDTFKSKDGDNIKALQWALRITHTSQKSMQWIMSALDFAAGAYKKDDFEEKYMNHLEKLIKTKVKDELGDFENLSWESPIMNLGLGTPHIIFAYLDYLLQKDNPVTSDDYYYNFRTSVEHLYPRDDNEVPDGQKLHDYDKCIDNFGNLFLINRKTNSRFSNDTPEAKWKRMAEGMPPKLAAAKKNHELSDSWADNEIREHCKEMIKVLKESLLEQS